MPRTLPVNPYSAEIQKFEEDIPLPTLAKRAVALEEMLDERDLSSGVHYRPKSQFYKELRPDTGVPQPSLPVRHDEVGDADLSAGSDSKKRTERKGIRSWFGGGGRRWLHDNYDISFVAFQEIGTLFESSLLHVWFLALSLQ